LNEHFLFLIRSSLLQFPSAFCGVTDGGEYVLLLGESGRGSICSPGLGGTGATALSCPIPPGEAALGIPADGGGGVGRGVPGAGGEGAR